MSIVFCLALAALSADGSTEAANPAPAAEKVEQVETVEAVEATPEEPATPTPEVLVGRMHPSVVHFPIAWLLLLVLVEGAVIFCKGHKGTNKLSTYLAGLTVLSFIPGIVTGLLRLKDLAQDPEVMGPALLHRNIMFACAAVCVVAWAVKFMSYRAEIAKAQVGTNKWAHWVYIGLILIAAALVSFGGHLGGELVYGEDYLPF